MKTRIEIWVIYINFKTGTLYFQIKLRIMKTYPYSFQIALDGNGIIGEHYPFQVIDLTSLKLLIGRLYDKVGIFQGSPLIIRHRLQVLVVFFHRLPVSDLQGLQSLVIIVLRQLHVDPAGG